MWYTHREIVEHGFLLTVRVGIVAGRQRTTHTSMIDIAVGHMRCCGSNLFVTFSQTDVSCGCRSNRVRWICCILPRSAGKYVDQATFNIIRQGPTKKRASLTFLMPAFFILVINQDLSHSSVKSMTSIGTQLGEHTA